MPATKTESNWDSMSIDRDLEEGLMQRTSRSPNDDCWGWVRSHSGVSRTWGPPDCAFLFDREHAADRNGRA
jgi:hypothetical protein